MDPSKLSPNLAENSWNMIARASEEGIASTLWKVGDEIDVVLSGDYKGSITMQIAGFDHDDLVTGGKAGITFLSKQTLGQERMDNSNYTKNIGWGEAEMRSLVMPKIRASFPTDLQKVIKMVLKSSSKNGGNFITEDDVFIPSLSEVFDTDAIDQKKPTGCSTELAKKDGDKYGVFRSDEDLQKTVQAGSGVSGWWTRSASFYSTSNHYFVIKEDAWISSTGHSSSRPICFGFCI